MANTLWVLMVMVISLILSSNNIYHQSRCSQSGRNLLISSFFFNLVAKMEGFTQLCSSRLPGYSRLRLKTKRVILTLN